MSATVLDCGQASQLFEVNHMEEAPQVHLHFLTDENEYKELGYGRIELCCHGCGESLLVLYKESVEKAKGHRRIRDGFTRRHCRCENRNYENDCPDYRSSFLVVDTRNLTPKKRVRSATPSRQSSKNNQSGTSEGIVPIQNVAIPLRGEHGGVRTRDK